MAEDLLFLLYLLVGSAPGLLLLLYWGRVLNRRSKRARTEQRDWERLLTGPRGELLPVARVLEGNAIRVRLTAVQWMLPHAAVTMGLSEETQLCALEVSADQLGEAEALLERLPETDSAHEVECGEDLPADR